MNNRDEHCRELSERIQQIFNAGFQANEQTVHFINSTFDYPDIQQLQVLLNDAASSDRDTLIDLIVSPDFKLCCEIEGCLLLASLSEKDLETVVRLLPKEMQTNVQIAGMPEAVHFRIPGSSIRRFLTQLKITSTIDPDIRTAIESRLPETSDRLKVLAGIRHSRLILTDTRKSFLLLFIQQSGRAEIDRWFFYLDFILDLLGRQKTDQDIFTTFGAEKQNCLIQMEVSRRLTEKLSGSNMETLLSQGCRIGLSGDISSLSRKVQIIDEICRLVWGRMPVTDRPGFQTSEAVSFLFEKELP